MMLDMVRPLLPYLLGGKGLHLIRRMRSLSELCVALWQGWCQTRQVVFHSPRARPHWWGAGCSRDLRFKLLEAERGYQAQQLLPSRHFQGN